MAGEDQVEQLMAVTGVAKEIATNLLEACGGNLEMAVNMHMEDQGGGEVPPVILPPQEGEEEVRAPIPQHQEMMIQPGYEGYALASRQRGASAARRIGTVRSVFDGFRDFEAETRRMEEHLEVQEEEEVGLPVNRSKKRTLEELFKPPLDLMWQGDWQSARDRASSTHRWLLVNIQDAKEFQCQVLNRDLWSNAGVKAIVGEHFVFWQQYKESDEAARYMTFYPITEWPHVSIVDPRTGENMVTWSRLDAAAFPTLITEFLSLHPSLESPGKEEPPRKKVKTDVLVEMDEEAQMAAAIKASLADTLKEDEDSGSDLETFSDEDSNPTSDTRSPVRNGACSKNGGVGVKNKTKLGEIGKLHKNGSAKGQNGTNGSEVDAKGEKEKQTEEEDGWKSHLGEEGSETTTILIRWPDGDREGWTQAASSKLAALLLYIQEKGYSVESHEVVTNFPRRVLHSLDSKATLKDLGLFPRETVFVHQKDN